MLGQYAPSFEKSTPGGSAPLGAVLMTPSWESGSTVSTHFSEMYDDSDELAT